MKKPLEDRREQFILDAINKQMEIAGYDLTVEDLKKEPEWFSKYTITPEKHKEFKEWWIQEFKKRELSLYRPAEYEFGIFDLMYGLKEEHDKK